LPEDWNYNAFKNAFERFADAQKVRIVKRSKQTQAEFDKRPAEVWKRRFALREPNPQPQLGQDPKLELMSFQVRRNLFNKVGELKYVVDRRCELARRQLVASSTLHTCR
jgi:hypothetical protein